MAVYPYEKYKISLKPDTHKTQGLQVGDVVRRQYADGLNITYSLMCVLENGVDRTRNTGTNQFEDKPYFIGALMSGSAPQQGEILDFVRVTNLFNVDRGGALYLTASDSEAPYMDVIDQIGRKASLSWPENIEADGFKDATSQYIIAGKNSFDLTYSQSQNDYNRILIAKRKSAKSGSFEGLEQQFYQFVQNPQIVLVSYRVKASRAFKAEAAFEYIDGTKADAQWVEDITTDWQYKFRMVTVEYSGRHLRTFRLGFGNMDVDDEIRIADFNIILLQSVEGFADASTMRIGKLEGIVDPVFGKLEGYGAYLQKLYATHGAHISGTLTAGDENGFGGTFYAGKIHRNCFINSIDVTFTGNVHIDKGDVVNPTGIGYVYKAGETVEMVAQNREWLNQHIGKRYCFSAWVYAKWPMQLGFQQNGFQVGSVQIQAVNTHKWQRVHCYFDLLKPEGEKEQLKISVIPSFNRAVQDTVSNLEQNPDEKAYYITAPQLEPGDTVTQYQATDYKLNFTDDYGAWFSRGGIGGTIQNPLLKLNYDGEGSIGTRDGSIEFKQDGSGHLAHENIKWDEDGKVTFGSNVSLNWDNLTPDVQDEMVNRGLKIVGEDTFTVLQEDGATDSVCSPASITLTLDEQGFTSTSSMRQWYVKHHGEFVAIEDGNAPSLFLTPDSDYWDGESTVTFKCVVTISAQREYSDVFTVKKQYIQGYEIRITSSNGQTFQNGAVKTVLTATVYYQGKVVDMDYVTSKFELSWERYIKPDYGKPVDLDATIGPANVLTINHTIQSSETYRCIMSAPDSFDYTFPITL